MSTEFDRFFAPISPPFVTRESSLEITGKLIEVQRIAGILGPPVRTSDFNFELPPEQIAQEALPVRDRSRLLVLNRSTGQILHTMFADLPEHLCEGDLLVLNNSKVIRARLRAVRPGSGGGFEILLLECVGPNDWWTLMKPGKRARLGTQIQLIDRTGAPTPIHAQVRETNEEGHRRLQFSGTRDIVTDLEHLGEVPLPPYIHRKADKSDVTRYQTIFAHSPGSIAAPTAGLHFTQDLLATLAERGVEICQITLHVGLGTFAPVKSERLEAHVMHEERYEIPAAAAQRINEAKRQGRRIVAVGTTALRTLESAHHPDGVAPGPGRTRLFAHPPFKFRVVDCLLTNFHLPRSTLLMLVCAFAAPGETRGLGLVLEAYAEAVRQGYRFFSYGDAMLIV